MNDGLSFVRGADGPPLLNDTIGRALDVAVERWGTREAIVAVHQNVRLTYRQLRELAHAVASGLLALGVKPGDRVGIWQGGAPKVNGLPSSQNDSASFPTA